MADTSNHNAPDPPDGEALAGRSDMSQVRLRKPELFGNYELLSRLRVGGMAEIFRARDLGSEGREVALKRILPSFTDEADYVAMFLDEGKLALRLHHPGIVEAYQMGREDDTLFIALEYVDGQDAGVLVHRAEERAEPLPVGLVCHVGVAVCEALHYAHELADESGAPLGVVHRDVSPQNILLGYDGSVKLIDFGIAKSADQVMKTQAGFLKGKHGYLSPEQASGDPIDRRSDLFSLGVCLYELLAAERLFKGASDFSTLQRVKKALVPPLSEKNPKVPEGFEAILSKALARNPDDRYATAAELGEALASFAEQEELAFGRANLSSFMHEAFAEERERDAREDHEALAHGDEGTGLSAFDDLEPPSAVSVLAHAPPEDALPDEGWEADEHAEVASAELRTVEPASTDAIEVGDEDLEPLSSAAAPLPEPEELTDELVDETTGATEAEPEELTDDLVDETTGATEAEPEELTDDLVDETTDATEAEPEAAAKEASAPGAGEADFSDITAVERPQRARAEAKADAEAEDEETIEPEDAIESAEAIEPDAGAAAGPPVKDGDETTGVEAMVARAVGGSVPGHLRGSTLPGLGMDWDDEELATQVYDGQDGSDPAMPKPLPPVGAPSPFGPPRPASARASVPPAVPGASQSGSVAPAAPRIAQVRMPGAPSMRPPAYPTPSLPPPSVAPAAQRPPAAWVLTTVAAIVALIALGLYFFREPAMATVHLNTLPPDTIVTLDGNTVPGTSSPFVITDVTPGEHHELRVEKEGYTAWSTQISPREGQVVQLPRVELMADVKVDVAAALATPGAPGAPAPAPAAAAPAEPAPEPPPAAATPAPAAHPAPAHHAPAAATPRAKTSPAPSASRFDRVRSEPKVAAGRWKPPPASASAPASGDGGVLRINSRPWAQVIVDGRNIGNTPQMRIPVSAGKHTVTLVNPQFGVKKTITLDVKPGETVTRIVTLAP